MSRKVQFVVFSGFFLGVFLIIFGLYQMQIESAKPVYTISEGTFEFSPPIEKPENSTKHIPMDATVRLRSSTFPEGVGCLEEYNSFKFDLRTHLTPIDSDSGLEAITLVESYEIYFYRAGEFVVFYEVSDKTPLQTLEVGDSFTILLTVKVDNSTLYAKLPVFAYKSDSLEGLCIQMYGFGDWEEDDDNPDNIPDYDPPVDKPQA